MRKDKVTDNVFKFIDRAAGLYGRFKEEEFHIEMWNNCQEMGMESPIEHLFWIACLAMSPPRYVEINPEYYHDSEGEPRLGYGLYVRPQAVIGKFRVDFLISPGGGMAKGKFEPGVIVELDGHAFHDKDARQRSYEKARDRFLMAQGYGVLHFTGSDVVADPFKCAHEALCLASASFDDRPYNPADPLSRGWGD